MQMLIALLPQVEDESVYSPDKANWSPAVSVTPGRNLLGLTGLQTPQANQPTSPVATGPLNSVNSVVTPPDPAIGGQSGPNGRLGWTKGIRPTRWGHQLFGAGMALRGTPMSVSQSKQYGNVGYRAFADRRAAGVRDLLNDPTPTNEQVSLMFAYATAKPSPIADEVKALR